MLCSAFSPLVLGAGSAAPFLQRRVHLENCGPKPVESRLHTFGHCLSSGISGLRRSFRVVRKLFRDGRDVIAPLRIRLLLE